ncbi:MAG: flagellar biosynthesis protein FlgL [Desulfovibrio sp.]|jgi:flagellar hook-associated protein 3 FlgL|nr:flagellar biosynthesis protein FlgL [Desulfovibrio sp.]
MVMRVTQGIMYSSFLNNMNRTLGDYMETNIQSSSQKRVNRPSDDPVAAGRILSTRSRLSTIGTYDENIQTAKGWLSIAESVLVSGQGSVGDILGRLQVLANQGATGTITSENRLEISSELRQLFEQLISVANTPFGASHLFSGHKTGGPAYIEGLAVTVLDSQSNNPLSLTNANFNANVKVDGKLDRTMILQPMRSGVADAVEYRYSVDGGETWVAAGKPTTDTKTGMPTIKANGVLVSFPASNKNGNFMVTGVPPDETGATPGDKVSGPDNIHSNDNGTWLYVRPTAIYQGDDHDTQVSNSYRPVGSTHTYDKTDPTDTNYLAAEGNFLRDVAVRLDLQDTSVTPPILHYSYSIDDGNNWTPATAPYAAGQSLTLPIPGGYLQLGEAPTTVEVDKHMQFVVHPHRADINFQIGEDSTIAVNLIGKEIFGGLYDYARDDILYPVTVPGKANLFETVGKLIAAAETGSQQGFQEALDELNNNVMPHVETKGAILGGRMNRLEATWGALLIRQYSEEDNLSAIEDADITELMTRLAQQQVAYSSVLKSSSMIMQLSLVNFL